MNTPSIGQEIKIRGRIATVTGIAPHPSDPKFAIIHAINRAGNAVQAVHRN